MKKIRILYIHHSIGLGGAPKSLSLLIAGLDKSRFEPIVVMPKRTGNDTVKQMFLDAGARVIEERDVRAFNGSEVAPCKTLMDRAYALLSYNKLVSCTAKLVDDLKPNLVHLNSTCLVGAAKGTHQADKSIPVIAHVREPLLLNWWGRLLAAMNRRHVDHFISIDKYGLDSIGCNTSENGDIVFNFVDLNVFRTDPDRAIQKRKDLNWQADQIVFLSLSRVSTSNGALDLANLVLSNSDRLHPSAAFAFAGFHEPKTDYAASVAESIGRSSRCIELPFDPDPVGLIDASDVIIAPFTTPHSARSVFEGAAMGKPAIVSNLPNLCELIQDEKTGLKFDLNNDNSFVEAVNKLCDSELRKYFGDSSVEFAIEKFDQTKNVRRTIDVYQDLLEKGFES